MRLKQHVDFDSLLSGVADMNKIAEALDDGHQAELLGLDATADKTASDKKSDDAVNAMAAGAAVAGGAAYHKNENAEKALDKLRRHDDRKLGNRIGKAIGHGAKTVRKTGRKVSNALTFRDVKREKLVDSVLDARRSTRRLGKAGLGLAAGAAGLKVYEDNKPSRASDEKVASSEDIRGQIANEVQRDSTPEGGAKRRGKEGAIVGGLAGFMHGATKNSAVKGSKAKLVRGLWHGTAGAVWGGGAMGAATYAKKRISPDTREDMEKEYSRRLEKRANIMVATIGGRSLADDVAAIDKEAKFGGGMDFTTPETKNIRKPTGTIFRSPNGARHTINHGRIKPSGLTRAIQGKGKADAATVRERAFINGSNKGKGVLGGVRVIFSGLTNPKSAIGKLGRKAIL